MTNQSWSDNVLNEAFWTDRPVFVTGGTGLVGSWLTKRLLQAGADVVCLVRDWVPQSELVQGDLLSRVRVVRGDITDQTLMERVLGEYEIDTVFHLAAQTIVSVANRNPVSTFEANIQGTWALLEACRRSPRVRQIVVASSDKAYGTQAKLPYSEDTPLQGQHPYDVSKSCADLIAQSYATTYDLPIAITRCGNFFGGGDLNWNRIIPGTVRSILKQERPVIRSNGLFIRDYFYVEDGAIAYMLLAEELAKNPLIKGQSFNFSYEYPLSVLDIANEIQTLMASSLALDIRNEATHEIPEQHLSAQKARQLLGWSPVFNMKEGLSRTIEWYKELLLS